MRILKRLLIIVIAALALAVGALFFLPGERIARIAADQISGMTGREVTMSGETTISFYPVLGISTGKTTIANADWSQEGPMLSAQSLKVGVDPMALIRGDIRITGLEAVDPAIILERAEDGRVNWQLGVKGVAASGQSGEAASPTANRLALTLDRALITGASLTYIDRAAGTRQAMTDIDLDLRWPNYEGEATFELVLHPKDEPVNISGRVAKVGTVIAGGISDLKATVSTRGGTLGFDGRGSSAPQLEGRLTADLGNTARFMESLGLPPAELPEGLGQSLSLTTNLTVSQDMRLALREMTLALDQNRITGAADVNLDGEKPRLTAKLTAGDLDLSTLDSGDGAAGQESGDGAAVGEGWSKAPIDASALALANGEVSLTAQSLDLGRFKFGATRLLATLDESRAVVAFKELQGYGGGVTGQFVANNRSGLSVGADLRAQGIDMEALLGDAAGLTRFAATGEASLSFLGVGQSLDSIMKSLRGNLALETGRGVISGFDLDKLMRSGDGTGGTTVFDRMAASFAIEGGNMQNDDLTMALPLARAEGRGRIGLGAQDIDYLFTPVLLEGENRRGLAIPVRIRGPWASPRITPDIEKAIDLNFKEEKKKLKEDAKKEVNKLIEKELGVTVGEGQSAEDAIKQGAEDKVVKELFKLFE